MWLQAWTQLFDLLTYLSVSLSVSKMSTLSMTTGFYHLNKKIEPSNFSITVIFIYFPYFIVTYSKIMFKKTNGFFCYFQLLSHYILNAECVTNENV